MNPGSQTHRPTFRTRVVSPLIARRGSESILFSHVVWRCSCLTKGDFEIDQIIGWIFGKKAQREQNREYRSFTLPRQPFPLWIVGKLLFMTDPSESPHRRGSWRRYILPFCVHVCIFVTYSALAIFALDSRSKTVEQNLLYCAFSSESASDLSDASLIDLDHSLIDGSSCE